MKEDKVLYCLQIMTVFSVSRRINIFTRHGISSDFGMLDFETNKYDISLHLRAFVVYFS